MDFAGMMRPIRFGPQPPDQAADVPRPLMRAKDRSRKLAALAEAADVLSVLPAEGESLHGLMTGRYDLADMLEVLIDRLGTVAEMRIATLSFNNANARTMLAWIDRGIVSRLSLLCSCFFQKHNPETYETVRAGFAAAGPDFRIAHGRNHCKVVCMAFQSSARLALEGSANMRTNSNREQFVLCHDAGLHDWHSEWIDHEVKIAQVNES